MPITNIDDIVRLLAVSIINTHGKFMTHILEVDESIAHTCKVSFEQADDWQERMSHLQLFAKSVGTHCQLGHESVRRSGLTNTQIHEVVLSAASLVDYFLEHGLKDDEFDRHALDMGRLLTWSILFGMLRSIIYNRSVSVVEEEQKVLWRTVVRTSKPWRMRSMSTMLWCPEE